MSGSRPLLGSAEMPGPERTSSPRLAVAGSVAGVLAVALVASAPVSPFTPRLPVGEAPFGPIRSAADAIGLGEVHGDALAVVGVGAVLFAVATFLFVLREAWRGTISFRVVVGLAIAYHLLVLMLPLLFSRDVYSYTFYGRISSVYHANPYVSTPSDFARDPFYPLIGPAWRSTPDVYGPLFTQIADRLTRWLGSLTDLIFAFQALAAAASLGMLAIVAWLARRVRPDRASFAVALIGLNPLVLFYAVGTGHNDLLTALAIAGGFALVYARRELLATAVLTLGALVKAPAVVPLVLLIVVVVVRAEPGRRASTALKHAGLALGIGLLVAAPFLQTKDPTLGMAELATHEGWLAPTRFFLRFFGAIGQAIGGDGGRIALEAIPRIAFPLLFFAALALIARALARKADVITLEEQGAAWGWGLLLLTLTGPVLLPWYLTWTLPVAWLLPRVPRSTLVAVSVALTVSLVNAEPLRSARVYDAELFFGHYIVTPMVIGLLAWLLLDLRRRLRAGTPFDAEEDVAGHVPAHADKG